MRRIALLGLTLLLPACSGFDTFFNDTHWLSRPNQPIGDSENMRQVRGVTAQEPAIRTEPGNVWPGPVPPQPTLEQLMQEENREMQQIPGQTPAPAPPAPGRRAPRGSSTPPGPVQPGLPPLPTYPMIPEANLPRPGATRGHVYQTPQGPETGMPGPGGYETLTGPNGGPGGIVVPNGNGTSTIIMPNGTVQTVPTPK